MEFRDQERLLNIFPEEVWEKILQNVTQHDKCTVSNASLFFRRLLSSSRQTFLFPSVWRILMDNKNHPLLDWRLKHPDRSIALKLRLVCDDWCLGVNEYYENRPPVSHSNGVKLHDTETQEPFSGFTTINLEVMSYSSSVINFLKKHSQLRPNRLSFKRTSVTLSTFLGASNNGMTRCFLRTYGPNISHLELILSGNMFSENSQFYSNFREWLTLVPNLRLLKWNMVSWREPASMAEILDLLENEPLPNLQHLKGLHFGTVPSSIAHHLVEMNNQVEYLNCRQFPLNFNRIRDTNLRKLAINIRSSQEFSDMVMFSNLAWKLEEITLHFDRNIGYIPWETAFWFLERFKSTLTTVSLRLPKFSEAELSKQSMQSKGQLRMDLPNVTHLELELCGPWNIDFILPLKESLQQLIYMTHESHEDLKGKDSGHYDDERMMMLRSHIAKTFEDLNLTDYRIKFNWAGATCSEVYHSGIWELFPKLKIVQIKKQAIMGDLSLPKSQMKVFGPNRPVRNSM